MRDTFVSLDKKIFKQLYMAFRPHIEYAIKVWCPYLMKDIEALDNVQ